MPKRNKYDRTSVLASRNVKLRSNLELRSRTMMAIRQAFNERGYLEVDTPILRLREDSTDNPLFSTLVYSGWPRLHLRTCPEEYTRRAAACFGKAFEIGKSFRNAEIAGDLSSRRHLAEFTHVEFYEKDDNLESAIELLWGIICDIARKTELTTVIFDGSPIDLSGDCKCLTIYDALRNTSKPECECFIEDHWGENPPKDREAQSKRLDDLLDKYVRPDLLQPTFLYCFPPTADEYPDPIVDNCVQRAEFNIGGIEIGEVAALETDVVKLRQHICDALRNRYGNTACPTLLDDAYLDEIKELSSPVIGGGFGLDRLMMILAGECDIRDVVWYPGLSEYFTRRRTS